MTTFQKIIKYGAIGFAIYLCIMIISMILFGITAIFGITTGIGFLENKQSSERVSKWEQEYTDITNLDIDLTRGKLTIKKGNTLKVEASNVSEQFKCDARGNQLKIEDQEVYTIFNNSDIVPEITIYLPETVAWQDIIIKTKINETNIEYLKAEKVKLEMGVGKYQIDHLIAKYAKIEAGAGEANILNSELGELKLDGGIGKLVLTSKITERADIDCGVGKMELNLLGSPNDYRVKGSTGLGNFEIDGKKIRENETIGNGDVTVKVDAGVGETSIYFQKVINKK